MVNRPRERRANAEDAERINQIVVAT